MKFNTITSLPQYARSAKRFTEILTVLARYGLAGFVNESDPGFINRFLRDTVGKRIAGVSLDERIRLALTELGPTFIKLGQLLSTREDLIGAALAAELAKLQSDTPPDPPEVVRATIESELGQGAEALFASFEDEAFASASIGQVHRATLKDGRSVVVKVQHEGIEATVSQDLDIFAALAALAEKHSRELRLYQPRVTAAAFARRLTRELDFTLERKQLEEFTRNFADDETVHIPESFRELSSRRVLIMERLDGCSVADVHRLLETGVDTAEVARHGATVFLEMIFRDGFYHADPHPGNILVLDGGVIGLLDCGMVGRVDERLRDDLESLLLGVAQGDVLELTNSVMRIGTCPEGLDRELLETDVSEFVSEYVRGSLTDFDLSGALSGLMSIVHRHRIILPSRVSQLVRVLVMLEGTSRSLNRDFALTELLEPYLRKMVRRRFSPARLRRRLQRSYRDWERLLESLPRDLAGLIDRAQQGRLDINLNHRNLDTTVNRLVYGIVTAALFLGSSMLWSAGAPPRLFGVSVIGSMGCAVAVILGVALFRAVRKSGGLGRKKK